jgi:D-sedoheptulose 7-phosphate isomerase
MKKFNIKTIKNKKNFFKNYFLTYSSVAKSLDYSELVKICGFIERKINNSNNIFIAGNGGSAAIANHFLCDFNKGIKLSSKNILKPRIISLTNSNEMITAIANDISYAKIFAFQMENYCKKGDCLICFSSSGQSRNIIEAINFAKKNKIKTILFQGFGDLNKEIKPNFYINLKYKNYGITEDIFQSILHMISQYLRHKNSKIKEIL